MSTDVGLVLGHNFAYKRAQGAQEFVCMLAGHVIKEIGERSKALGAHLAGKLPVRFGIVNLVMAIHIRLPHIFFESFTSTMYVN